MAQASQARARHVAQAGLALRVWLALLLGALSSCAGVGPELARPAPPPSAAAVTGPPPAHVERPRPAAKPLPTAAPAPAPAPPVPDDALAEQLAGERAVESGYDQRFPLYGVAFHVLAQVFAEPDAHAEVIGYLRRGSVFRAAAGHKGSGCARAWHELASGGFACAGRGFAFGSSPQRFEPAPLPPAMSDPLPYRYAKNSGKVGLQYWRVPTPAERSAALRLLAAAPPGLLHAAETSGDPAATAALGLPDFVRAPMEPGFYVSLDGGEPTDEDGFARTVRGAYVETAALGEVTLGAAPGVVLHGPDDLPLGIAYRGETTLLRRDALDGELRPAATLPRFGSVRLTETRVQSGKRSYLLTRDGFFVAESQLRVVRVPARPPLVPRRARFIHVDLEQQALIAYEGPRPVFATLVSTGKPGYDTPQGIYRIYAKHVSTTMDGLVPLHKDAPAAGAAGGSGSAGKAQAQGPAAAGARPSPLGTAGGDAEDEAYSIEDVPWTMYFQGSYALHAAFWHDHFGRVRSHGCVNLAPADAQWLFRWSTPTLPSGWHGVVATRDNPGTWIGID